MCCFTIIHFTVNMWVNDKSKKFKNKYAYFLEPNTIIAQKLRVKKCCKLLFMMVHGIFQCINAHLMFHQFIHFCCL